MGVGVMRDSKVKLRDLNDSHTLGCTGRNNSKPGIGSHGHAGGTRPGQTKKDLEREERRNLREHARHYEACRN